MSTDTVKSEIPFMASLALADNAAQILAGLRPSNMPLSADHPALDQKVRMLLRENAVTALRWLWQSGDASQRGTVAARVAVWLHRDLAVARRVMLREKARGL